MALLELKEKVALFNAINRDPRFTPAECNVAGALILYFHNTTTGACYPSYAKLAERSLTSKSTAKRTTKKLQDLGYIEIERSNGGCNRRNRYVLVEGPLLDHASPKRSLTGPSADQYGVAGGTRMEPRMDPQISMNQHRKNPKEISFNENGETDADTVQNKKRINESYWAPRERRLRAQLQSCSDPVERALLERRLAFALKCMTPSAAN